MKELASQKVVHRKPNYAKGGCVIYSHSVDNPCCPYITKQQNWFCITIETAKAKDGEPNEMES